MVRSCLPACYSGMLMLLAASLVAAWDGPSRAADDVTVYKVQNRWKQFIFDAGAKVGHDKGGDDAKYRWVLKDSPAGTRIKNLATGAYLVAPADAGVAKLVPPVRPGAPAESILWTMDVVTGDWLSIKSTATGKYMTDYVQGKGLQVPCDELDIIEAYGGEGPGHPNAFDAYMICPHAWNQGESGKSLEKQAFEGLHNPIRMRKFGIPSTWFDTLHTYGCKITVTDTVYYCDNVEVGRHATLPLSKQKPFFFLINLATGGGWPVDLSRYNGLADMYVDFVRVYQGKD